MTIQELLEKYENMLEDCEEKALPAIAELKVVCWGLQSILYDMRPTVSAEVADWCEESKNTIDKYLTDRNFSNTKSLYLRKDITMQMLVNMHQFGYDIAKDPVYRIISKSTSNFKGHVQVLC